MENLGETSEASLSTLLNERNKLHLNQKTDMRMMTLMTMMKNVKMMRRIEDCIGRPESVLSYKDQITAHHLMSLLASCWIMFKLLIFVFQATDFHVKK